MIVDFHVHSTASDGTLTPAELSARTAGFAAVALTDHDNCDGLSEWHGIGGIELSVDPGDGFDQFHLLGLGVNPENAALKAFLRRILEGRNERNAHIIENFRRLGIELEHTAQPVFDFAHGEVLARPHFAQWLVAHGFSASPMEAFATYLKPDSPAATRCYEPRYHPAQEEAIGVLHAAGALAIMAHPKYARRQWQVTGCDFAASECRLAALKEKGLDGVEALYQANTNEENVAFTLSATRLGLLKTAGSDFHGANKPTIPLGMEVTEQFISPLLERLNPLLGT